MQKCLDALPEFNGLEHRLEYVAEINGVQYINDSICTVPEAAIAAVNAFDGADCIILGGMDRGISYDVLGEFLNKGVVETVILLPDSGKRIGRLVTNPAVNLLFAEDMEAAVRMASEFARKRVLLSPASASYGFYRNFEVLDCGQPAFGYIKQPLQALAFLPARLFTDDRVAAVATSRYGCGSYPFLFYAVRLIS